MLLTLRARIVILAAVVGGLLTFALGIAQRRADGVGSVTQLLLFSTLLLLSWRFPLVLFKGTESESIHLDEGFLVLVLLLMPVPGTVTAFLLAAVCGQLLRRQPAVKVLFNLGQILSSVGLAALVSHVLAAPARPLTIGEVGAAVLGAATFMIANGVFMAAILAATNAGSFRRVLFDGIEIRLTVCCAGVVIGVMTALTVAAYPWALPLAFIPSVVLHQILAGHFRARRDRERMNGLFRTAVDANRSMGTGDVEQALLEASTTLLRCTDAEFSARAPSEEELGALVSAADQERWLLVAGRRRAEPFDEADHTLLEAVAAIGAGALDNARLYERLADVVESSSDGIVAVGSDERVQSWNPAMERITGYSAAHAVGQRLDEVLAPIAEDDPGLSGPLSGEDASLPAIADMQRLIQISTADGQQRWLNVSRSPLREGGSVLVARDYTAKKQIDDLMSLTGAITDSLGEGVYSLDREGRVTFMNPAAEQMLGWSEGELTGHTMSELAARAGTSDSRFLVDPVVLRAVLDEGELLRNDDAVFCRRDGSTFPVAYTSSPILNDAQQVMGAVVAFRDITERKAFEEQLSHRAFHDALTGLPNRRLFLDRLEHALARSARGGQTHALLFIDIDRFKLINDSLGHQAGDQLLLAVAARVGDCMRPGDTFARFGGDEFTLLLEDVSGTEDAELVAQRAMEVLREPFQIESHEVFASVSVGIAVTSGRHDTPDDLLHDADVAMYRAKEQGKGRYEVFHAEMGDRSVERLDLEAELRRALDNQEFEVHYQPLYATASGQIVGAEALVRWNHPTRGLLSPAYFIALAEETGLILPLGHWVLEESCRRARAWQDRYPEPLRMSVNLSARQFQQAGLAAEIAAVLATTGVDSSRLCLEITESIIMDDAARTAVTLHDLKRLGVRLAIDDFGTGYSSLSYLKRFPVDVLKIDRSFVDGMSQNAVDSEIVTAVTRLAQATGKLAIAEGVETAAQLEHLRALGCPVVQGFHLARPQPAHVVEELLNAQFPQPDAAAPGLQSVRS